MYRFLFLIYWTKFLQLFVSHEGFLQKLIDNMYSIGCDKPQLKLRVLLFTVENGKENFKFEVLTDDNKYEEGIHYCQGPWGFIVKLEDVEKYFEEKGLVIFSSSDRLSGLKPEFSFITKSYFEDHCKADGPNFIYKNWADNDKVAYLYKPNERLNHILADKFFTLL